MEKIARTVLTTMVFISFSAISANAEFQSSGNFFDDFDADGDGMVSQSEFQGPDDHFSQLDADDDGYVNADEGPTGPPGGRDHAGNGPEGGGPRGEGPEGGGPGGEGSEGGGPGGRS